MSERILTPLRAEVVPTAPPTGPSGNYRFVLDLQTEEDYRKFDVGMAARYRITSWAIVGTMRSQTEMLIAPFTTTDDTLTISETITGFADGLRERDFACPRTADDGTPFYMTVNAGAGAVHDFLLASNLQITTRFDLGLRLSAGYLDFRFDATFEMSPPYSGPVSVRANTDVPLNPAYAPIGTVTVRVPAWRGTGWHSVSCALYPTEITGATYRITQTAEVIIQAATCFPYDDIWDPLTCQALKDPTRSGTP